MNEHVNTISGRFSLRQPQRYSLEVLTRITEIISLNKNGILNRPQKQAPDAYRGMHNTNAKGGVRGGVKVTNNLR